MTGEGPVLVVTKEFGSPATSGGMLRTLALVEWLAQRAPVVVVHPGGVDGARLDQGRVVVERLRAAPASHVGADAVSLVRYRCLGGARTCGAGLWRGLRETLDQLGPFTVAVLDHTCLFGVADLLPARLPVVLSTHNVESDLMAQRASGQSGWRRGAAHLESRLLRRLERSAAGRHPTVVCTPADAEAMVGHGASAVVVARNGVTPPQVFGRAELVAAGGVQEHELLFTGALDWQPNIRGILWLIESPAWRDLVARRPGLVLTVAGRNPGADLRARVEAAPGARIEADVPSMQPLLERARLGVAPLLEGGGSRIKLLEYIAHGLPSVSTVVGASGLDGLPSGAIVQTPQDASAFCAAVEAQLDSGPVVLPPESVAAMLERYGWERALAPVEALLPF